MNYGSWECLGCGEDNREDNANCYECGQAPRASFADYMEQVVQRIQEVADGDNGDWSLAAKDMLISLTMDVSLPWGAEEYKKGYSVRDCAESIILATDFVWSEDWCLKALAKLDKKYAKKGESND